MQCGRGGAAVQRPPRDTEYVHSHRREHRPFGLTSLEAGGWRCPRVCRWRLASGRRKMVKLGRCWPVPRGACGAGGAPASGNGATTPPPEAGVRKHPAPQSALRLGMLPPEQKVAGSVRKHPAPTWKRLSIPELPRLRAVPGSAAPESRAACCSSRPTTTCQGRQLLTPRKSDHYRLHTVNPL